MNQWLTASPNATVAHGQLGVMVSVADQANRVPHGMQDGDVEDHFGATALTPLTAPTIRRLATLDTTRLALMHAPTFTGDAPQALGALADAYAGRLEKMVAQSARSPR